MSNTFAATSDIEIRAAFRAFAEATNKFYPGWVDKSAIEGLADLEGKPVAILTSVIFGINHVGIMRSMVSDTPVAIIDTCSPNYERVILRIDITGDIVVRVVDLIINAGNALSIARQIQPSFEWTKIDNLSI